MGRGRSNYVTSRVCVRSGECDVLARVECVGPASYGVRLGGGVAVGQQACVLYMALSKTLGLS